MYKKSSTNIASCSAHTKENHEDRWNFCKNLPIGCATVKFWKRVVKKGVSMETGSFVLQSSGTAVYFGCFNVEFILCF